MEAEAEEAGAAAAALLLVAAQGLAQVVGGQRAAVAVAGAVGEGRVAGQLLAGGQAGGGGLPLELDLARSVDDVADEQLGRGADGCDDVGGDGLREGVVDQLEALVGRAKAGNVRGGRAPSSSGRGAK